MATISQIKSELEIVQLNLNQATDVDGNPAVSTNKDGSTTAWFRHWDNTARVAVSLAEDLLLEIQADPTMNQLGLQTEIRTGSKGDYTSHRIVKYKAAQHVL